MRYEVGSCGTLTGAKRCHHPYDAVLLADLECQGLSNAPPIDWSGIRLGLSQNCHADVRLPSCQSYSRYRFVLRPEQ